MTSALRGREGGWSKRDDSTDRLREWDSDKGGGGPKIRKFCGRHLSIAPYCAFIIIFRFNFQLETSTTWT